MASYDRSLVHLAALDFMKMVKKANDVYRRVFLQGMMILHF